MSDVIKLLPDSVANQIAAGEVIQRPASVIKELVENAIDAQATHVQIILKDAGRTLIQIIDDGVGMSDTDARLAFERHSTSKIRTADDLFSLHTMGFRGEALASIAAISQVELRTRRHDEQLGTRLVINASQCESQEPDMCPPGSNFMVKNIFYNVPARRKFLKSNEVELNNIVREFEKLAMVNHNVEFTLMNNGHLMYKLLPGSFLQRVTALMGKVFDDQLIPVNVDTTLVRISGYVSKPSFARKRNYKQFLFVNERYMKHPYFHKAILSCYDQLIPQDKQPNYFLRFTVDPETHVLTLQNTEGEMYNGTGYQGWEATGLGAVLSDGTWAGFMSWNTVLTPMTEAKPAVPCDPVQLAYENGSEWEKANFHFHIMPFDVDGNRLYEENYSYRIYMDDDQLFTFKADEYGPGDIFADGDLTEIPLNYSDYMNIISWDGTRVYFFQNNTDEARLFDRRIGVQAVYTVDGVSNASNIIYMSVMRVNGVVVDLAGKPVPNVQVSFSVKPLNNPAGQRTAGTVPVYVTTDENGEFATELNAFVDYQVSYLVDWQSVLDSELYTEEDDINLGEIVLPIGNSAISDVKAGTADDDIYYDLMGRKFRGDNLPAGIYIHGGKKVLVK